MTFSTATLLLMTALTYPPTGFAQNKKEVRSSFTVLLPKEDAQAVSQFSKDVANHISKLFEDWEHSNRNNNRLKTLGSWELMVTQKNSEHNDFIAVVVKRTDFKKDYSTTIEPPPHHPSHTSAGHLGLHLFLLARKTIVESNNIKVEKFLTLTNR